MVIVVGWIRTCPHHGAYNSSMMDALDESMRESKVSGVISL